MLDAPTSAASAGLWAVVAAVALLALGYLIVDALLRDRDHDALVVWGCAFVALAGYAAGLMCVHMATRGWLFSSAMTVRLVVFGSIAGLVWHKRATRRTRGRPRGAALVTAALVVAGLLIWGSPVFRMLPLTATADTQLHNGWVNQLLDGATTPGAVITGDIPNYYPWLFHSLSAIATHLIPGSEPYISLGVLQLLIVWGQTLALFALGRTIYKRVSAGAGAALLGTLSGGIGFVALQQPDVVMDPRAEGGQAALRYLGDLLFSRSYNVAFHGIAPPFPRDMAFALLASVLLLLALALATRSVRLYMATGAALGLSGLTGGEAFIVAVVVAAASAVAIPVIPRRTALLAIFGTALPIYALWALPMVINYVSLGGFVSITHITTVDLPGPAVLGAWGISALLALVGAILLARQRPLSSEQKLAVVYILTATLVLIGATQIPGLLGDAFDTLGRPHRYWPLLHLGVALLGGVGLSRVVDLRPRALGPVTAGLVTAIAIASPVAASLGLPKVIGEHPVLEEALAGDNDSVLNVLNESDPTGCVAAIPQEIAREAFSYTGYPLVLWTGNWFGPNRARIRWADIYERIPSDRERLADNRVLVNGWGSSDRADGLIDKYGVDLIVSPQPHDASRVAELISGENATAAGLDYVVQQVGECGS
ncbi:MAG TPA: hypothetical protein VG408_05035 [Actinomycetota bacterium]|nr:hypothetical protein [Actinomycetota bacterium]